MEEQLVSFETAELAKEKGLKRQLDRAGNLSGYNLLWKSKSPTYYHVHTEFPSEDEFIYAPTQSLLQKWLREEHKLYVGAIPAYGDWTYWTTHNANISWVRYNTYEEALEAGLIESLKLIK